MRDIVNQAQTVILSTANRGVEVKEPEIADHLERSTNSCSSSVPLPAQDSERSAPAPAHGRRTRARPPTPAASDTTSSYLQVVVQKHRSGREPPGIAATPAPRLPSASSPLKRAGREGEGEGAGAEGEGMVLVPASLLLARAPHSLLAVLQNKIRAEAGGGATVDRAEDGAGELVAPLAHPSKSEKSRKSSTWKLLGNLSAEDVDQTENGELETEPERVEVYYLEQGCGAWLATSGGAPVSRVERAARRPSRRARAALAEPLAAARLLLSAPFHLIVALERCILTVVRDAVTGAVQTASDYALKPALVLTVNAALRPPLVALAAAAGALRAALRPLALAAADAVEPVARLLASLRLVSVHLDRQPCTCTGCGRPSPEQV